MITMHKCFHCGGDVIWQNDFSFEDFGYEGEGLVHILRCSKCEAEIEYRIADEEEDNNTDN